MDTLTTEILTNATAPLQPARPRARPRARWTTRHRDALCWTITAVCLTASAVIVGFLFTASPPAPAPPGTTPRLTPAPSEVLPTSSRPAPSVQPSATATPPAVPPATASTTAAPSPRSSAARPSPTSSPRASEPAPPTSDAPTVEPSDPRGGGPGHQTTAPITEPPQ